MQNGNAGFLTLLYFTRFILFLLRQFLIIVIFFNKLNDVLIFMFIMEQKLKDFKSRRRREMLLNKPKELFLGLMNRMSSKDVTLDSCEIKSPLLSNSTTLENSQVREEDETSIVSIASDDTSISLMPNSWLNVMTNILYIILWGITFLIAVHLEFGFVYVVLSGLAFIYFNTRTGPKKKGEISAYSVFNPGCEAIEGTLKAEQLEREFNLIQHK